MQNYKRNGNRWSVNEILNLQREYELLEWNVQEIARKHQRSVEAILYKLESEGFISSWNEARGLNEWKNSLGYSDEDEKEEVSVNGIISNNENESEIDKLTERVWGLETSVEQISTMVKQMFDKMVVNNRSNSRTKLRNYSKY